MDSVSLASKFRSFTCTPHIDFLIKPLSAASLTFFHLTNFKKPRTSIIAAAAAASSSSSSSNTCPSNLKNSNPESSNLNFSVLFPFWEIIKQSAISQTQKWVSSAKACSDTEEFVDEYKGCYLQNGGLGIFLLSVTTNAKLRISPFLATLAANPTFVSGLFAWIIAQSIKVFLNFFVERKWDLKLLFASGGMPSSHSALCTALTTSVALCHGVADSLFPVCLGFSLIVMYDAIGVRRHAGMQAEVLNMIVADLFQGHPMGERKLKEFLGHTPSQVLAGAVLGTVVACFCRGACTVAA